MGRRFDLPMPARLLVGAALLIGLLAAPFLALVWQPAEATPDHVETAPAADTAPALDSPTATAPPTATPSSTPTTALTVTHTPPPRPTTTPAPTSTPTAPPLLARFSPRPGDRVTQIKPGIVYLHRVTADPLRIHVLLLDLTAPQLDLRTAIGGGLLGGRNRTSGLVAQAGAIAGVNGDVFGDNSLPEGLTIVDSKVAIAPKYRAAFAWSHERVPYIGYFTADRAWQATVEAANGQTAPLGPLNAPCDDGQLCLYNDLVRLAPARAGDVKVLIDRLGRVTGQVQGEAVRLTPGLRVLQGTGAGARWLRANVAVGHLVTITLRTSPPLSDFAQAISSGPLILRDGAYVQDCLCAYNDCRQAPRADQGKVCEDFTTEWKQAHYLPVQLPRVGVAYDRARQTLILAQVDGYQRGFSRGMTMREFADLLLEFGADMGMELDSGGSATMVVQGRVVNRPPDDTGERYVPNALVVLWHDTPRSAGPTPH